MGKHFLILALISIFNHCNEPCPSFKKSEIKIYGIDVSHYQNQNEKINWTKVSENKDLKVSFAYIRSTMGKDGVDTAFKYNIKNAKKNKIKTGIYHYYRPDEKAIEFIDIGGPSILRAAAKNFNSVVVLSNPNQYEEFIDAAMIAGLNCKQKFEFNFPSKELTTVSINLISS